MDEQNYRKLADPLFNSLLAALIGWEIHRRFDGPGRSSGRRPRAAAPPLHGLFPSGGYSGAWNRSRFKTARCDRNQRARLLVSASIDQGAGDPPGAGTQRSVFRSGSRNTRLLPSAPSRFPSSASKVAAFQTPERSKTWSRRPNKRQAFPSFVMAEGRPSSHRPLIFCKLLILFWR